MDLKQILRHPLFKSSLIYTCTDAVNKAVPLLILPILSYYLLPSDYGIVANYGVMASIISIFVVIGVDSAIAVSYYKLSKKELATYIFNGILIITLLTFLLLFAVFLFSDVIYTFVNVPIAYQLLSVIMALTGAIAGINLALWRLEEKPLKFGMFRISQTVVELGLSFILVAVYKLGWIGRINGMLVGSLSFGFFSLFLIHQRGYLRFAFNKASIIAILSFGLPLIPHSLSFWLRSGIDRVLITKLVGVSATGLYATGFQFGILISFITMAFNNAFVPYMYRLLGEADESKLRRNKEDLRRIIVIGVIVLIILCIIFTSLSKIILTKFFSDVYKDAADFIYWAILSQTFQGMYLFFVNYIFYVKKTKSLAVITFSCALLQVILSYFWIIESGAIGAAYATVVVSFINFVIIAWYSNKVYPMNWFKIK